MAGRDMSVQYTEEEIESIIEACRKFPSCDGKSFSTSDFDLVAPIMRWDRTQAQVDAFRRYWQKYLGGRLGLEEFKQLLRDTTCPSAHAGWFARKGDLNGDGTISKDEFEAIYELMSVQWSKTTGKTFEDFVREADTNKDGRVDIAEFTAWLAKNSK